MKTNTFCCQFLYILLFALLPIKSYPTKVTVDVIEINHFYDDNGKRVFDQAIFWDMQNGSLHVREWFLLKIPQYPVKDKSGYYKIYVDSDGLPKIEVLSRVLNESWTQYDPELLDREKLPKEKRIGLLGERATILEEDNNINVIIR